MSNIEPIVHPKPISDLIFGNYEYNTFKEKYIKSLNKYKFDGIDENKIMSVIIFFHYMMERSVLDEFIPMQFNIETTILIRQKLTNYLLFLKLEEMIDDLIFDYIKMKIETLILTNKKSCLNVKVDWVESEDDMIQEMTRSNNDFTRYVITGKME